MGATQSSTNQQSDPTEPLLGEVVIESTSDNTQEIITPITQQDMMDVTPEQKNIESESEGSDESSESDELSESEPLIQYPEQITEYEPITESEPLIQFPEQITEYEPTTEYPRPIADFEMDSEGYKVFEPSFDNSIFEAINDNMIEDSKESQENNECEVFICYINRFVGLPEIFSSDLMKRMFFVEAYDEQDFFVKLARDPEIIECWIDAWKAHPIGGRKINEYVEKYGIENFVKESIFTLIKDKDCEIVSEIADDISAGILNGRFNYVNMAGMSYISLVDVGVTTSRGAPLG